jgi:hypothetical protein
MAMTLTINDLTISTHPNHADPYITLYRVIGLEGKTFPTEEVARHAARTLLPDLPPKMADKDLPIYAVRFYSEFYVEDVVLKAPETA